MQQRGIWLLLHPHTVHLFAAVCLVVSKVSQIMLTNIPRWVSCGFSLPSTRSSVLLLWPRRFKMISEDSRSMWKIFVAIKKGQLVLMVWHALEATGSVWMCVCVFGLGQSDTRMDLMGATGQGADRFIRVVSLGCPVSQSAVQQLPGLQWQPWWAPGGPTGIFTDTGALVYVLLWHTETSTELQVCLLKSTSGQFLRKYSDPFTLCCSLIILSSIQSIMTKQKLDFRHFC